MQPGDTSVRPGAPPDNRTLLPNGPANRAVRRTNVRVTVVFPGAVATNITTNSGVEIPMTGIDAEKMARRILPADRAARLILDGTEHNAYRVMVGSDAKLMDRLHRLNPRWAADFIAGQMKDLLGP